MVCQSWKCYLDSTRNIWKWPEANIDAKLQSVQCPPPLGGSCAGQLALSLEEFAGRELCPAVESCFVAQLHAAGWGRWVSLKRNLIRGVEMGSPVALVLPEFKKKPSLAYSKSSTTAQILLPRTYFFYNCYSLWLLSIYMLEFSPSLPTFKVVCFQSFCFPKFLFLFSFICTMLMLQAELSFT